MLFPSFSILVSILFAYLFWQINNNIRLHRIAPINVLSNEDVFWEWRNFFVSLIHSSFSGIATIICVKNDPSLLFNLLTYDSVIDWCAHVSFGYFIHDTIELILSWLKKPEQKGFITLIIHHFMAIYILIVATEKQIFLGFVATTGFIELHSIFLHIRKLMTLADIDKNSKTYQAIAIINLTTCVVFRGLAITWLTLRLLITFEYHHHSYPNLHLLFILFISMFGMISFQLFRLTYNTDKQYLKSIVNFS